MIADQNPYATPQATEQSSRPPRAAAFPVGSQADFVEVFCSLWSGLEIYTVNGVEVMRIRSFRLRSSREFQVGEHRILIKYDYSWRRVLDTFVVLKAYVDDELVVRDLAPTFKRKYRSTVMTAWIITGIVTFLVLFLAG